MLISTLCGALALGCSWHVPVQVISADTGISLPGAQVTAISAKKKKNKFKRKVSQAVTGLDGKAEMKLPRRMTHHRIQIEREGFWTAGATVFTWRTGEPEVLLVSPEDRARVPHFLRFDDEVETHEPLPPGFRRPDRTFHPGRTVVVPLYGIDSLESDREMENLPREVEQDLP